MASPLIEFGKINNDSQFKRLAHRRRQRTEVIHEHYEEF